MKAVNIFKNKIPTMLAVCSCFAVVLLSAVAKQQLRQDAEALANARPQKVIVLDAGHGA